MMEFNEKNTEILVVNYNTPDYVIDLYKSIRKYIGNEYHLHIVDGTDNKLKIRGSKYINMDGKMCDIFENDKNVTHYKLGFNIHHGPGMDYGINRIKSDNILILDSDVKVRQNLISLFTKYSEKDFTCIGLKVFVDKDGFNVNVGGIPYIHPSCMLLRKENYINKNIKFIKHGAPCLEFMKKCDNSELIAVNNDEFREYIDINGRGTVNIYGYSL